MPSCRACPRSSTRPAFLLRALALRPSTLATLATGALATGTLVASMLAAPTPVAAQTPPAAPPTCDAPEHRQFDFWLGEWEVVPVDGDGPAMGRNTISRVASGCALREHWVNARGLDGHSLNVYDRDARRWTQFWIGSDGVILRLQGGLRADGAMEMRGDLPDGKGGTQRQRIVWTPHPDGSVLQVWDVSDDDGITWRNSFSGRYRRVPAG